NDSALGVGSVRAGVRGGDGFVQRGENPPLADCGSDAVPVHIRAQIRADPPEYHFHILAPQIVEKLAYGPCGGVVDIRDRTGFDDEPGDGRRRVRHEHTHVVDEAMIVGIEQIRAKPVDECCPSRRKYPARAMPTTSKASSNTPAAWPSRTLSTTSTRRPSPPSGQNDPKGRVRLRCQVSRGVASTGPRSPAPAPSCAGDSCGARVAIATRQSPARCLPRHRSPPPPPPC